MVISSIDVAFVWSFTKVQDGMKQAGLKKTKNKKNNNNNTKKPRYLMRQN